MKQFYLFLILIFSFNLSSAQDNSLLGHWSLDSIVDIDILLENPENPIFIEFTEPGNEIIITDFCGESYTSLYSSSTMDNAFNISESDSIPPACSEDVQGFQNVTFNLFGNTTTEPKEIIYNITQIDGAITLMLYYELFISDGIPEGISASFTKISSPPNPNLIGDWYLDFINTNDVIHNNHFNETQDMGIEFTSTIIDGQNNLGYEGTSSCNFFGGSYTADESTIILNSMEITLIGCEGTALNVYESAYFSILGGNTSLPNNLIYTITGTNEDVQLTLINQDTGDFAVFGKTAPTTKLVKQWYLTQIDIPGNPIINIPISDTPTLNLTNEINPLFFKAEANGNNDCNDYNCLYNLSLNNGSNIQIENFEETLVDCVSSNYALEYTSTLGNSSTSFFDYEISVDGSTLTLTDLLGVSLIYGELAPPTNMLGEWFLYNLVIDSNQIDLPSNTLPTIEFTTDSNGIGFYYGGVVACSGYGGGYYYNPQQTFSTEFLDITLGGPCDTNEEDTFEDLYLLSVLDNNQDNIPTELDYEITGTGDDATLVVTNLVNGNQAFYGRQALSIDDIEFYTSEISLSKNPVSKSLELSTTQNLVGSNYEIFSITGQRIANGVLNSHSINVNQLHTGLYFLKVSKDENVFETVKFIKQ